ncbi:MAG: hypothetical protein Aurels2KO_10570 [Aureliella sp.]
MFANSRYGVIPGLAVFCFLSCVQPATADLIAHWTGDGTAVDATGNGHDGSLFGNTTYAPGKIGQAFSFDGADDYVRISTTAALEPSVFSVAAWVNVASTGALVTIAESSHGNPGASGWALQIDTLGRPRFAVGSTTTVFPEAVGTSNIFDGNFHHLAGVFDGTDLKMYVDGAEEATLAFSGTVDHSGRDLRIGAWWGNGGAPSREVNGLVDEVRFYNNALSAGQVSALAVPEPSSLLMFGVASVCLAGFRRQPRRAG